MNTESKGSENTVFDVSEAFFLGYENWYEPSNPYEIGSNNHIDYNLGVKQAIDEQF